MPDYALLSYECKRPAARLLDLAHQFRRLDPEHLREFEDRGQARHVLAALQHPQPSRIHPADAGEIRERPAALDAEPIHDRAEARRICVRHPSPRHLTPWYPTRLVERRQEPLSQMPRARVPDA